MDTKEPSGITLKLFPHHYVPAGALWDWKNNVPLSTAVAPKGAEMKLSEAIRKGAAIRPQAFGTMFDLDEEYPELMGSCVLGAAWEGAGNPPDLYVSTSTLVEAFPELESVRFGPSTLMGQIVGRNDNGESREEIADWLESIGQ